MQDLQTSAQVANADAGVSHLPVGRGLRAVIVDTQAEIPVVAGTGDAHGPSGGAFGNAVLDGIFHQRLQQEVGNLYTQQLGRNVHADFEPLSKANLLNVDVALQILDFLSKGHLRAVRILRSAPQKLTEPDDHAYRGIIPAIAYQPGDGIEGIEHEVRLYLAAQGRELSPREFLVESRGLGDLAGHALT